MLICLDRDQFAVQLLLAKGLCTPMMRSFLQLIGLSFVIVNHLVLRVVKHGARLCFAVDIGLEYGGNSIVLIRHIDSLLVFVFGLIGSHLDKVFSFDELLSASQRRCICMNLLIGFHGKSHHLKSLMH
jgi:hypothetical protein